MVITLLSGRSYQMQTSPDLVNWTNLYSPVPGNNDQLQWRVFDAAASPRVFVRWVITLTP